LESALGFRVARAFAEEIGIPTEVLDRRDRDRIDAVLDRDDTGGAGLSIVWAASWETTMHMGLIL
jgi:hypothetical protein